MRTDGHQRTSPAITIPARRSQTSCFALAGAREREISFCIDCLLIFDSLLLEFDRLRLQFRIYLANKAGLRAGLYRGIFA
jgi:hypothetical protein